MRFLELEGWYMGGHPAQKHPVQAVLFIDGERLTVAESSDEAFIVEPWRNVTGLFVQGPPPAETSVADTRSAVDVRLGRTGVGVAIWNGWWLKKKTSASYIVLQGTFGEFIFEVTTKSPERLRAKVGLWAGRIDAASTPN